MLVLLYVIYTLGQNKTFVLVFVQFSKHNFVNQDNHIVVQLLLNCTLSRR